LHLCRYGQKIDIGGVRLGQKVGQNSFNMVAGQSPKLWAKTTTQESSEEDGEHGGRKGGELKTLYAK